MDAKITKKRLGLLLSYDWIKIIGICVAAVLVWSLLFTTIGTRPSNGQRFEVYLYPNVRLNDSVGADTFHAKDENGALSYDILDFSTNSLSDDAKDTVMTAHFAAGQGDVLFAAAQDPTVSEGTNEIAAYNGIDDFISRYYGYAAWLDPSGAPGEITDSEGETHVLGNYFADCAAYLDKFYDNGWEDADSLNEQKVRDNFDVRMERDKRFKNEAQRELGRQKEIVRIQNLRDAYEKVMEWLNTEDGPIQAEPRTILLDQNNDGTRETTVEMRYTIDLSNITNLTEFISSPNESGNYTGNGMHMVILNTGS